MKWNPFSKENIENWWSEKSFYKNKFKSSWLPLHEKSYNVKVFYMEKAFYSFEMKFMHFPLTFFKKGIIRKVCVVSFGETYAIFYASFKMDIWNFQFLFCWIFFTLTLLSWDFKYVLCYSEIIRNICNWSRLKLYLNH